MLQYQAEIEKSLATVIDGKQTYPFIITTNSIDRVGDILNVSGMILDEFEKNPVIFRNHQKPAIGRSIKIERDNSKIISYAYLDGTNEISRETKASIDAGTLRTASIGFEPTEWEDKSLDDESRKKLNGRQWIPFIRTYTKSILVEWSVVDLPANIEAELIRAKIKGIDISNLQTQKAFQDIDFNSIEKLYYEILKGNKQMKDEDFERRLKRLEDKAALELVKEINELDEDEIQKAGAVLNRKNRQLLEQIKTNADEILSSATNEESSFDEPTTELSKENLLELIKN
jgi:hypothetical protein